MTMIGWMLWKNRNDIVWRGKRNNARFLVNLASRMLYKWTTIQSPQIDLVSNLQGHHGFVIWSSPPPGKVKINIDAALFPPQKKIGVGCIVRDAKGIMLSGFSKPITGNYTAKEAKALGVREALSWLKTKH